jgi:VIT1/CCC1 family predicted Fe2+/Mn2+ transporter
MTDFPTQHLDPASHMGEALFGLIMTLTFTLGADLVIQGEGREGVRQMMIGILGCNLAWGLIDGVLYVLERAFERGRLHRISYEVHAASSPLRGRQFVAAELDELLVPLTALQQRDTLYAAIVRRLQLEPIAPRAVTRKDLLGGMESGLLVFACSLPAVLPFLLIDDPTWALRVSNGALLALLYYLGYRHARHTLARPWIAGLVFLLAGLFLVAVAIQLGG